MTQQNESMEVFDNFMKAVGILDSVQLIEILDLYKSENQSTLGTQKNRGDVGVWK